MIEGEKPKPQEIGETEKREFIKKANELVTSPRFPDLPVPGYPPIKVTSSWESKYRKGEERISVSIPVPGDEEVMIFFSTVAVEVTKPLFDMPEGYTVFSTKQIRIRTDSEKSPEYYEGNIVWDKKNKREVIPSKAVPQSEDEPNVIVQLEKLQGFFERQKDEEIFGNKVVTRERYNDIMGTLNKLTPEDEVKE